MFKNLVKKSEKYPNFKLRDQKHLSPLFPWEIWENEDNQAFKRKALQKREKELENEG